MSLDAVAGSGWEERAVGLVLFVKRRSWTATHCYHLTVQTLHDIDKQWGLLLVQAKWQEDHYT